MSVKEPKIAVVVPCHRSEGLIQGCLDALERQTIEGRDFEVLVVETEGEETAGALLASRRGAWAGRFKILAAGRSPGEKRNLGARSSEAPYLAFTDPDCRPEPGWLAAGLTALEDGASIVSGPILPPEGRIVSDFGHYLWVGGPSELYESANVFYERGAFERAGGFPTAPFDELGEHFGEDTMLAWAVRRLGVRSAFAADAVVRHESFERDFGRHLAAQRRARHFPYLVRRVPELRESFLRHRLFLSPVTERLWLAVAGLALARRLPVALILAIPWLASLVARSRRGGRGPGASVAAAATAHAAADVTLAASLAAGSVRHRAPVL